VQDVVESRVIFPEHLPLSQLQQGVRSGRFVQGTFLASRENYLEGTLRVRGDGDSDKEVLIQGLQHLNRAMHDDIVCVEMFPEERWVAPSSLVLHDEGVAGDVAEENEEDVPTIWTAYTSRDLRGLGSILEGDPVRRGGALPSKRSLLLLEHDVPHTSPSARPYLHACPLPRSASQQSSYACGVLVCLVVHVWPPTYRPPTIDKCENTNEVGLPMYGSPCVLFVVRQRFVEPGAVCVPYKDQAGREDLRALSICSVDPPGYTDIDDALHCKPLDNGNTEVGVHIADVSYFIRPGNALDEEASLRGTTVYLCEK
uniref:Uncharacterized protein n=1 Tax=Petromyzon marinus TaxID=7757 RepID=S4RS28_PETMA